MIDKSIKIAGEMVQLSSYAFYGEVLMNEIERLHSELQWIHDGAHTRGHTLPDIKARCHHALGMTDHLERHSDD